MRRESTPLVGSGTGGGGIFEALFGSGASRGASEALRGTRGSQSGAAPDGPAPQPHVTLLDVFSDLVFALCLFVASSPLKATEHLWSGAHSVQLHFLRVFLMWHSWHFNLLNTNWRMGGQLQPTFYWYVVVFAAVLCTVFMSQACWRGDDRATIIFYLLIRLLEVLNYLLRVYAAKFAEYEEDQRLERLRTMARRMLGAHAVVELTPLLVAALLCNVRGEAGASAASAMAIVPVLVIGMRTVGAYLDDSEWARQAKTRSGWVQYMSGHNLCRMLNLDTVIHERYELVVLTLIATHALAAIIPGSSSITFFALASAFGTFLLYFVARPMDRKEAWTDSDARSVLVQHLHILLFFSIPLLGIAYTRLSEVFARLWALNAGETWSVVRVLFGGHADYPSGACHCPDCGAQVPVAAPAAASAAPLQRRPPPPLPPSPTTTSPSSPPPHPMIPIQYAPQSGPPVTGLQANPLLPNGTSFIDQIPLNVAGRPSWIPSVYVAEAPPVAENSTGMAAAVSSGFAARAVAERAWAGDEAAAMRGELPGQPCPSPAQPDVGGAAYTHPQLSLLAGTEQAGMVCTSVELLLLAATVFLFASAAVQALSKDPNQNPMVPRLKLRYRVGIRCLAGATTLLLMLCELKACGLDSWSDSTAIGIFQSVPFFFVLSSLVEMVGAHPSGRLPKPY